MLRHRVTEHPLVRVREAEDRTAVRPVSHSLTASRANAVSYFRRDFRDLVMGLRRARRANAGPGAALNQSFIVMGGRPMTSLSPVPPWARAATAAVAMLAVSACADSATGPSGSSSEASPSFDAVKFNEASATVA